jgi:hypothetical protein
MQFDDQDRELRAKLKGTVPEWDKMKNWQVIEEQLPPSPRRRRWLIIPLLLLISAVVTIAVMEGLSDAPEGRKQDTQGLTTPHDIQVATDPVPEESQISYTDKGAGTTAIEKGTDLHRPKLSMDALRKDDNPGNHLTSLVTGDYTAQEGIKESATEATHEAPGIPGSTDAAEQSPPASLTSLPKPEATSWPALSLLPLKSFSPGISKASVMEAPAELQPVLRRQGKGVSLQAYALMLSPMRQFTVLSAEQEAYLAERESLETLITSYEAGILLNTQLSPTLSLRTGIGIEQINERLDWENVNTQVVPLLSDTAYFYLDASNQPKYIADTVDAVVTETRRVKNFNAHTFVNIPLLIGYERALGTFALQASAGPVLQLYRGFDGKILDEGENLLTGEQLAERGIYRQKVGVGLQAGMEVSHSLGRLGKIHARMQYRHGRLSVTESSAGYRQSYNSLGFGLAWSFRLHR